MTNSDRLTELERQNRLLWDMLDRQMGLNDINSEFKDALILNKERNDAQLDSITARLDKYEDLS